MAAEIGLHAPSMILLKKTFPNIPEQIDDGWETASLNIVGMNVTFLENLMNRLDKTLDHQIHILLIVKEGNLVFEEYFLGEKFNLGQYTGETGFDRDDTHTFF